METVKDKLGNELRVGHMVRDHDGKGQLVASIVQITDARVSLAWPNGIEFTLHREVFSSDACGWVREGSNANLVDVLAALVEAVTNEVNEKGAGGYLLARLSDARAALALATAPQRKEGE